MDISPSAISALYNAAPALSPLDRAMASLREQRTAACNGAECRRHFLRDLYRSLPDDVLAWSVYPEDRIVMSTAWRELSAEAKTVGTWAMGPSIGRPYVDERHVRAAFWFFENAASNTDEGDEVNSLAINAAGACLYLLGLIEQEAAEAELATRYDRRTM